MTCDAMPGGGIKVDLGELAEVGKRLSHPSSSKEVLCSVLEQASMLFNAVQQSSQQSVLSAMQPSMDALVRPGLLKHKDKDVRVLVATCISEIMRIVAPDAPYSDEILKEIFDLIVASFKGLNEKEGRYFDKRLKILEIVATVRSSVVMLDLELDDLIREMFQTFFATVSEEPKNLIMAMRAIMCLVLEESEEVPQPLLEVLLRNLLYGRKGVSKAAFVLARAVCEKCIGQLTPYVEAFLTSTIAEGKLQKSKWKDSYHDLLFEIARLNQRLIDPLVPKLVDELQTEKLDLRFKAVKLVGRLLVASAKAPLLNLFQPLLEKFIERFSDVEVDVRLAMIDHTKNYLIVNTSSPEAEKLLAACSDRLKDDNVGARMQAVGALFEYARANIEKAPINLLKKLSECLEDTEVSVRLETYKRLIELHELFCSAYAKDQTLTMESFCWIPSKLISCCSSGNPKEFRPHSMELVFSDRLFPLEFSVEDRVKCWISFFSAFDKSNVESLERILDQKQRLQDDIQSCLDLLSKTKDEEQPNNDAKLEELCKRAAKSFVEPVLAEAQLRKLVELKDPKIEKILADLLDPDTSSDTCLRLKEELLMSNGGDGLRQDFLRDLAIKCSAIFGKEHIRAVLAEIMKYRGSEDEKILRASMDLLVIVGRFFPRLLVGVEEAAVKLLQDERDLVKDGALLILAQVGGLVQREVMEESKSLELLERLCWEGSSNQAKLAVQILSAVCGDSRVEVLTGVYERLKDHLHSGDANLPTVLESLGCIAEHAPSTFQTHQEDIEGFVIQDLFTIECVTPNEQNAEQKGASASTRLKLLGLKMLTHSFQYSPHVQPSKGLLHSLLKLLELNSSDSEDNAQLRLGSARAVLKLSQHFDDQMSSQLFLATILCAKDPSTLVKSGFSRKVYKLLMEQSISNKYACAIVLSTNGSLDGPLEEAKQQLSAIVKSARSKEQTGEALENGVSTRSSITNHLEYVLFYLIHSLAQEVPFPGLSNGDPSLEDIAPFFRQLYLFVWALLNPNGGSVGTGDGQDEVIGSIQLMLGVCSAIKKAEDVVASSKTEISYILSDIVKAIIEDHVGAESSSIKAADDVPLPQQLYRALESTPEGEDGRVDKSRLPTILQDMDIIAELKAALPFKVVTQRKRKSDYSSEEEKLFHTKRGKVIEDERKEDSMLQTTSELQKRSWQDKAKPLVVNTDATVGDLTSPRSSKRRRGGPAPSENGEVSSPLGSSSAAEVLLPSSPRRPKRLKVHDDDVQTAKHGAGRTVPELASPNGSATKPVRILIKRPKVHPEPASPVNEESSNRVKKKMPADARSDSEKSQPLLSPRRTPRRSVSKERKGHVPESVDELVGCSIRVWWPMDKKFYKGVISSYQPSKKKHKVDYDDGDVEYLNLDKERWEKLEEKMGSPRSPLPRSPSLGSKKKNVDGRLKDLGGESMRSRSARERAKGGSSARRNETELASVSHDDSQVEEGSEHADGDGGTHPVSVSPKQKSREKSVSSVKRSSSKTSDAKSEDDPPGGSPQRSRTRATRR